VTFARQSLGSLASLMFGVLASILLARLLGAEGRGEYTLAVKVAGLVLAVAQWGVPEVLLQLLGEQRYPRGTLIGASLALGLAGVVGVGLALVLAFPFLSTNLLRDVDPLLLGLTLVGSSASLVGLLARRFIQLDGHVPLYNALDVGRTALFLGLVVLAAAKLPGQALGATLAWLVAECALALAAGGYLRRRRVESWRPAASVAVVLARAGAPIQVGLLAMFIGSEGGAYLLNARLDLAAVGVYTVALSVARLVLQVSLALRTVLQARLVGPTTGAADVTARVTRHGLLWMLLLAAAIGLGAPLVPTIFGRGFAAAPAVLVLMLPGMVAYGVWQLLAGHLLRVGRRATLAGIAWVFAVASMILQALGAQAFGLPGAAAGLSVAYLLAAGIAVAEFQRATGYRLRTLLPGTADLHFYAGLARGRRAW